MDLQESNMNNNISKLNNGKKKKKKWIIILVVIVILFILSMIGENSDENESVINNDSTIEDINVDSELQGEYDDEMIDLVRGGTPNLIPHITYEEAYEYFFTEPKWRYFEATDGSEVVEFSGGCLYNDDPVTVYVQFVIDQGQKSFDLYYASLDGISVEDSIMVDLIYEPFSDYAENVLEDPLDPSIEQQFIEIYEAILEEEDYLE